MHKFFLAIGALLVGSSLANAGVLGHSRLSLSNIRITNVSGGDLLTATFSGQPANVSVTTMSTSTTNSAFLTGSAPPPSEGGSLIASVSPGSSFSIQASDVVAGDLMGDYMRSQSDFGGSYFQLVNPALATRFPAPAFSTTRVDFNVDTLGLVGNATSNVTNTSQFNFQANESITANLELDAVVDMLLTDQFAPPNFFSSARTSFSVSLTQAGSEVAGFGNSQATNALNNYISIPPSGSPVLMFHSGTYNFNDFELTAGSFYTLTINQTVAVDVDVVVVVLGANAVPEPASGLAFALLAGCGILARLRRRRRQFA